MDKLPATIADATFTPTALIIAESTNYEDWATLGKTLQEISRAVHWWIGDWIRFGEHKWGEKYAQAIENTPFAIGTLQNDVWVAAAIPASRRREQLTFNHHAVIAALPPAEQDEWLDIAEREGWSSRKLWAESRGVLRTPETFYSGPATLGGHPDHWVVYLPTGQKLDKRAGDEVIITIKEAL